MIKTVYMIKHCIVATATACVVAMGSASADVKHNDGKKLAGSANTFASLDRNGDHRISRSEAGFDTVLSQTFAEIDTDADGFVSSAEYAAAEKNRNPVSSNLSGQ